MGDEVWSVRRLNKLNAEEKLSPIKINKDETNRYTHDDATKFIKAIVKACEDMLNPLDRKNGMAKLFEQTVNEINKITSKDTYDYKDILRISKAEATAASRATGAVVPPDITDRANAQEEADRMTKLNQAVIGAKEGIISKLKEAVGDQVLAAELQEADGEPKGIDDISLYKLKELVITGANRTKSIEILKHATQAITFNFDFRKKVAENIARQKVLINKATSFGLTIDASLLATNLLRNMEYAEGENWGREFRPCMQAVRKKYDYNYQHDATTLDDMIAEFSTADRVRDLRDAPEPTDGTALEVNEMTEQLKQLQNALGDYGEYQENAYAAAESDSDVTEKSRRKKKKDKKTKHRSVSRSRGRSLDRDRQGNKKPRNTCKHCKKQRKRCFPHDEAKCYRNKDWKGYRPEEICEEMGIPFKSRKSFPPHLGGPRQRAYSAYSSGSDSDSSDDSSSDSE